MYITHEVLLYSDFYYNLKKIHIPVNQTKICNFLRQTVLSYIAQKRRKFIIKFGNIKSDSVA